MSVNSNPGNATPQSGGLIEKRQLFTATGTFTRPLKLAGTEVFVTAIGGGGSGRREASPVAGDGGEFVYDYLVDIGGDASVAVTIGAGGAAVTGSNAEGNNGGVTSFGSYVSVSGGIGGNGTDTAGTGGARGGYDSVFGTGDNSAQDNPSPVGGNGGPVRNVATEAGGGGGLILDDTGTAGGDAGVARGGRGYGAGGGAQTSADSGAGADGALLVRWFETL